MNFVLSKILWMFVAPGNLLVLLLLAGVFLSLSRRERWQRAGRGLCFAVAFVMFFVAVFPAGEWALRPLENRFPPTYPDHVDGIVIVSSGEKPAITQARGQFTVTNSASGYIAFGALARKYPAAKLVFTGGEGLLAPAASALTEADVARQTMSALGIDVSRVTFESKSRTTHENAVDTAALVHPARQQTWLLVANAFHMPRTIGCFRKAGWNVAAAPADYLTDGKPDTTLHFDFEKHIGMLSLAVHEYYGLLYYYLMGYTDSPWPGPQK